MSCATQNSVHTQSKPKASAYLSFSWHFRCLKQCCFLQKLLVFFVDEVSAHLYLCLCTFGLPGRPSGIYRTNVADERRQVSPPCERMQGIREKNGWRERKEEGRGTVGNYTGASQVAQQSPFLLATVAPLPIRLDIKTFSLIWWNVSDVARFHKQG